MKWKVENRKEGNKLGESGEGLPYVPLKVWPRRG